MDSYKQVDISHYYTTTSHHRIRCTRVSRWKQHLADATSGRRPGASGTQQAILDATRARFAEDSYAAATIRMVAADANITAIVEKLHNELLSLIGRDSPLAGAKAQEIEACDSSLFCKGEANKDATYAAISERAN